MKEFKQLQALLEEAWGSKKAICAAVVCSGDSLESIDTLRFLCAGDSPDKLKNLIRCYLKLREEVEEGLLNCMKSVNLPPSEFKRLYLEALEELENTKDIDSEGFTLVLGKL